MGGLEVSGGGPRARRNGEERSSRGRDRARARARITIKRPIMPLFLNYLALAQSLAQALIRPF
jgi:hypothetical protein